MFHSTTPTRLSILLMLAGAAAAQSSGGPTMALAQGFSVDTTIGPYSSGSVILNDTDFDASVPPMVWIPNAPDFNQLTFAGCDVDALSLGFDWVFSDASGFVSVPAGRWGLLTYTVRPSTVGVTGTVIHDEALVPGGVASDIFAYVLPGSFPALPLELVGVPFRAQDSTEITAPPGSNVDAHDVFLGLLYRDNPQVGGNLPPPTVYFSVTDATKGLIPVGTGPSDWTAVPALASGATVFRTTWQPWPYYSWTTPSVYLQPTQMGLQPTEDLDGLALDLVNQRVLLSTDPAFPPTFPTPPRNPLLYSTLFSMSNTTYMLPGGGPVSTAIGLVAGGADDADGICMLDPGAVLPNGQRLDRLIGKPQNAIPMPGVPTTLQMSLVRQGQWGTSQEYFRTFLSGWPSPGTMQPGFAVVALTIDPPPFVGNWWSLGLLPRPNSQSQYFAFQGHPERYDWQLPYGYSGIAVTFVWGALSSAGSVALSHPATITL